MTRGMVKLMSMAGLVVGLSLAAGMAEATIITMTPGQASSFTGASCAPATCVAVGLPTGSTTTATVIWTVPGPSTATFSSAPLGIAFGAGDQFAFNIFNSDVNTWDWQAVVHTTLGDFLIPLAAFAPGSVNTLVTSAFGAAGSILGVDVIVSGVVPVITPGTGNVDYSVNFTIAAVPEPGTLLLIGSGLAGLALRRRRRV